MQIVIKNVTKAYQRHNVLVQVSFQVDEGECFGIIGPNGSGKSTLLKLLSAVEKPQSGEVQLNHQSITSYSKKQLARQIAVLLQDALPSIDYKVRDILEMGRYPYQNWLGDDSENSEQIIEEIAYKLCLEHLLDRSVMTLSGGERQRVALGKAMAQKPKLLLLDEPTTFLDIGHQMQMMDLIRQWQRESGLTVVAVLHDLNLAAQYCDRIMVLHKGEQMLVGTPGEVMHDEFIETVFGTKPIVLQHPITAIPQILLQPGADRFVQ